MIFNKDSDIYQEGPQDKDKDTVVVEKTFNFDWDIWFLNLFRKNKRNGDTINGKT